MESVKQNVASRRLSKKQMWIFAIGQLGWSMLSGIITTWLVTYYLPTAGDIKEGAIKYITPGLVIGGFLTVLGLITALSRIFDAVTDPLIATLSDRSTNKRGRRIPFMQYSAIPLSVVTVLLFCCPVGDTSWVNILWVSIFILLFYLFMTMYCTPYNALISEFGKTQEDRMFISTAISLTFFAGTLLAYMPFLFAGVLRGAGLSFAWSYRVIFIVLAVIACVAMLLPTFFIKEKDFVDAEPSKSNVFKSLTSTFKNKEFKKFVGSDIMYWIGLTLFQTGLPFFVKVSMNLPEIWVTVLMGAMTVLSACFYPFVTKLVQKFGKKKLVIAGFLGLALAYVVTALSNIPGLIPTADEPQISGMALVFGVVICIIAALPMSLLGIIPQSIVADVAEADSVETGEKREGMFFAARTFAMKFGQSIAMLAFTSLAILGTKQDLTSNDIVPSTTGLMIVAFAAVAFCVLGAVILLSYREKHVMSIIAKDADKGFFKENALSEDKEEVKEEK